VSAHLGDPALTVAGVQEVRAAFVSSGALDAVEAMIDERADCSRTALGRVPLQEPAAEVLEALVGTATARQA
jgi:hypothetical protein